MSSFISNITGGGDDKKATKPVQTSNPDLMTTAKQWAGSAQTTASDQSAKAAASATGLFEAAKKSGADGTKAAGEYIQQAKDYVMPPAEKKEEPVSGFGAGTMKAAGDLFKK